MMKKRMIAFSLFLCLMILFSSCHPTNRPAEHSTVPSEPVTEEQKTEEPSKEQTEEIREESTKEIEAEQREDSEESRQESVPPVSKAPVSLPSSQENSSLEQTGEHREKPEEILSHMTAKEKVCQLFLIPCPEQKESAAFSDICPGGIIFYGRDFEPYTPKQAAENCKALQKAAKVPLLTAVDEEGGKVTRISRFPAYRKEPFPAASALFAEGKESWITDTREKCLLLKSLGICVNLAPVCDVPADEKDYIFPRCYAKNPQDAAECVQVITEEMNRQKTGAVLKHFPGYAGNADTHKGISVDCRSMEEMKKGFLPFRAGIEAGADGIMMAHNIIQAADAQHPASLSAEMHRILRNELGFQGVILTDSLSMKGITGLYEPERAAVEAIRAGNDMLCTADWKVQIPAVLDALESGELSWEPVNTSVLRILRWKEKLGLLDSFSYPAG